MRSKFGGDGNLSEWWYKDRCWLIFQDGGDIRYFDMNIRYNLTSPGALLSNKVSLRSSQKYIHSEILIFGQGRPTPVENPKILKCWNEWEQSVLVGSHICHAKYLLTSWQKHLNSHQTKYSKLFLWISRYLQLVQLRLWPQNCQQYSEYSENISEASLS